jgi:hypothetical protein
MMKNTLAYYFIKLITPVKRFTVQAPVVGKDSKVLKVYLSKVDVLRLI